MWRKYFILAVCFLALTGCVIVALYLYNKPHQGVAGIVACCHVSAADLYGAFARDEREADRRYVDKVVEVKGKIATVEVTDSTENIGMATDDSVGRINCDLTVKRGTKTLPPAVGATVTIKGRCAGFLQDVNLVDCLVQ
jgi:hypothetical protein